MQVQREGEREREGEKQVRHDLILNSKNKKKYLFILEFTQFILQPDNRPWKVFRFFYHTWMSTVNFIQGRKEDVQVFILIFFIILFTSSGSPPWFLGDILSGSLLNYCI